MVGSGFISAQQAETKMSNVTKMTIIFAIIGLTFLPWFAPVYVWLRPLVDLHQWFDFGVPYTSYWVTVAIYSVISAVLFGLAAYCEGLSHEARKARSQGRA
ncbi:MAG: hypothetical protein WCD42_06675 [Rhizomicrobium sp.]